ncbi:hypothetical protein Goklo_011946, partial [Gossypium klotzschianum]|nr:hypothetical protein [Gossypium klotzschianum]
VSFGIIVIATIDWLIFEKSRLLLLPICSDVLLISIVLLFIYANYAAYGNSRQLGTLPELEMSEEMVNTTTASLCVKINNVLLMAQDMTLGNDSWIFF